MIKLERFDCTLVNTTKNSFCCDSLCNAMLVQVNRMPVHYFVIVKNICTVIVMIEFKKDDSGLKRIKLMKKVINLSVRKFNKLFFKDKNLILFLVISINVKYTLMI